MHSEIWLWLPYAVLLCRSITGIWRQTLYIFHGRGARRAALSILALVILGAVWSMVIVSAGPEPAIPRDAMRPYIRYGLFVGGLLLILVDSIEAWLSVWRHEAGKGNP